MKKILFIIVISLLVGCQDEKTTDYRLDGANYNVVTPYLESVSSYTKESYDTKTSELMLMKLLTQYYSPNSYLYQNGQYLTTDYIKEILTKLDDNIITLYEQNYVNGKDTDIVVALIYKDLNDDVIKDNMSTCLELLKEKFKENNIVVTAFLESDGLLNGNYKHLLIDDKFTYLNYNYQFLDGSVVMKDDMNTYNGFSDVKNGLNEFEVYINGIGLYRDNELLEIDIAVNKDYLKTSEILYMSEIITDRLNNFKSDILINVNFYSNGLIKATLKQSSSNVIDLNILEG